MNCGLVAPGPDRLFGFLHLKLMHRESHMCSTSRVFVLAAVFCGLTTISLAQQSKNKKSESKSDRPPRSEAGGQAGSAAPDGLAARLMTFDKNKDGKLTRDEITDDRLLRLFDRADANRDGVVTKDELSSLATQSAAEEPRGGGPRGGQGGPRGGGPGGPDDRGPGDPGGGGPGGFGGPPSQPGQVLSNRQQEELRLSAEQKRQLDELQREVDDKLAKILSTEQRRQLKELRERGPGAGGPGNGAPGVGGPPNDQGRPRRP